MVEVETFLIVCSQVSFPWFPLVSPGFPLCAPHIKTLMHSFVCRYYPQASESVHTVVPEKFGLEPNPEMLAWLECPEEHLEILRRSFLRRMFALATDSKTTRADKDEHNTNAPPSDNQHNSLIVIDSTCCVWSCNCWLAKFAKFAFLTQPTHFNTPLPPFFSSGRHYPSIGIDPEFRIQRFVRFLVEQ